MIDKEKIQQGSKLVIWSSKYNCEKVITITYRRSGVLFFLYENDNIESWLPIGSYIIEKAELT